MNVRDHISHFTKAPFQLIPLRWLAQCTYNLQWPEAQKNAPHNTITKIEQDKENQMQIM